MAKRPEEEQPQAMEAMDQTTQSPDPVAGSQPEEPRRLNNPETGRPFAHPSAQPAPMNRGNTATREFDERGGRMDPNFEASPPRREFDGYPQGAPGTPSTEVPRDPNHPALRETTQEEREAYYRRNAEAIDDLGGYVPEYLGGRGFAHTRRGDPGVFYHDERDQYRDVLAGRATPEEEELFFAELNHPYFDRGYRTGPQEFVDLQRLNARLKAEDRDRLAELNERERLRREERDQFYRDRQDLPDYVQQDIARAEAGLRGEDTSPPPPTGPQQTPEEAMLDIAERGRRRQEKGEEESRANALATERARMRRGLPPLDPQARAAVQGGAEAMQKYRQGPQAPAARPQAGQAEVAPGTVQRLPYKVPSPDAPGAGRPEGGYQTGQTVQLQNMPGGQESTRVYSLGGGIALPDGQGMSNEDFLAAYEQLNPGKSPIDAIQGLSREPGPRGNAARKLLRDAGATGGAPLNEQQRQQLQEQLGDRAGSLLRGHAQDMASGISSAARGLSKAETDAATKLQSEAQDIRRDVYAKAQKAFEADETGRSFEQIFADTMGTELARRQYEQGEPLSPELIQSIAGGFAPPTPERGPRDFEPVDVNQLVVRPDSVPYEALGEQGFINPETGQLGYKVSGDAGEIQLPAAYHAGKVVPVLSRPDQTGLLPPGTPYILGEKYMFKGTPGRPSSTAASGTATAGTSRGRSAGKTDAQVAQEEMSDIRSDLQTQREKDFKNSISGLTEQQEELKMMLASPAMTDPEQRGNLEKQLEVVENQIDSARREANLDEPITNEAIMAEYKIRQDSKASDLQLAQDLLFETGNAAEFDARGRRFLPEGVELTASATGTTAKIGNRQIPVTMVGNTPVMNPGNVGDIFSIELNARGNVFVGTMGEDAIGIVGGEQYKQSSQARLNLTEMAEKDKYAMFNNPEETIGALDEYVTAKYPDLEPGEKEVVMEAVARSVGLSAEPESRESVMQRREEAGFGEVYEGARRQKEAMDSDIAGISPEAVLQKHRRGESALLGRSKDEDNYDAYRLGSEDFADRAYTIANEKAFAELPQSIPMQERLQIARDAGTEAALDARAQFRAYARENGIPTNTDELNALKGRVVGSRETADEGFVATRLRERREAEQRQLETDRENTMREATRGAFFGQ